MEGSTSIEVKVTPHAKTASVRLDGDLLRVSVVEAAERGKANKAVERAVAAALGVRRREVRIVSGARSRRKLIVVDGMGLEKIRSHLAG